MSRFVLVAHGTRGDVDPFLALAGVLHRRGHEVAVHTHAVFEKTARATGARFRPIDNAAEYDRHLRRTATLIHPHPVGAVNAYYRDPERFLDRISVAGGFPQLRGEALALCAEGPGSVLIGRVTSALSALIAAEVLDSRVVQLSLSPFQSATAPVTAMHLARAAAGPVNRIRAELGLRPISEWHRWLSRADLTVGLWPAWFDRAGKPAPAGTMLTDFAPVEQASPGSASPSRTAAVLVTGGTGRMVHGDFYPAALAGLAAIGRPVVVVTRHPDLLPARLPVNVEHRTELNFGQVLPSVAAVVHHGGINTCAAALAAGTPQLILAHGGDRPDNGARLERLGLARCLTHPQWTADRIHAEVEALTARAPRGAPGPVAAATGIGELADACAALCPTREVVA
ncbi:glycosyltransferase [Actinoplanes sp. KI2]|uniref:glycosyltransferase n=1 Tax=Actinoplanes sp. KI2 TaxID=2983315 RepID=UPI0021D5A9EE|nr:nucleotide disphospho-sugar-binding domain-containing protein [Actinoplanes sp. KI2]MCU7725984.1 glycosyltransferase [Actinoplanes sp. KI2]